MSYYPASSNFSSSRYNYEEPDECLEEGKENDGKIGLSNIGNTCFMNSALQCVFHNDFLKSFFLRSDFETEINENNPLGTKGTLFREIGKLFKSYYWAKSTKITPSKFKNELGNNNPIFEGYQQHDSQEFWSYVIDMIHEDSNRILKKPYVENIEGSGKEQDYDLARKSWVNYLKRNYSIVTENFIGQYKSRVDCQTEGCLNTSITFDPFTIISLSIPNITSTQFDYLFSPQDEVNNFREFEFAAKSGKHFSDIKLKTIIEGLARKFNKETSVLRLGHFNYKGHSEIYNDKDCLSKISEKKGFDFQQRLTLMLTELNENDVKFASRPGTLPVFFTTKWEVHDVDEKNPKKNTYDSWMINREYDEEPMLAKFFYLTTQSTIRDLYISVFRKMYYSTDLCLDKERENRDLQQQDFERIWREIETEQTQNRFFYIKHNDNLLSRNLLDETIENELEMVNGRLDIKVFIRNKDYTPVIVNMKQKTHQEYNRSNYGKTVEEFSSESTANFENSISLEALLKRFEDTEVLDDSNLWRCPKCKQEVAAKKSMYVYKAPNYLTIHFKKNKTYHNKIPLITFPKVLDFAPFVMNKERVQDYNIELSEFMTSDDIAQYQLQGQNPKIETEKICSNGLMYKLFGIVNHYGSQNFGHYTSACEVGGVWTEFNDGSVSPLYDDKLVTEEAYILFYKRI